MKTVFLTILTCMSLALNLSAQDQPDKPRLIQFSGVVVTEDDRGEMTPLPYTTIAIKNTRRGTYAEIDGFFSIVAAVGDTVIFSRIGYKTVDFVIQDTLKSSFYSWYQVMTKDNVLLPEAVIYAWPSRDHYKIEFLSLDISDELRSKARENLAKQVLEEMQYVVGPDGNEAFSLNMQRQIREYQYAGQYKPQNIFNPVAWAQFIKAWKRGDFKKKN